MNRRGVMSVLACGAVAVATGLAGAAWQPSASTADKAKVGEKAPDFTLTDLEGKEHKLSDYTKDGKIVVLEWFNPDCPWVVKHHTKVSMLEDTQKEFKKEVVWLAINSGAKGKQGTGVERNLRAKKDFEITYPILLDESGKVGKAYGAKTTPHMYVIDKEGVLRYMGAADSYLDEREHAKRDYTREAIVGVLAGETIETTETKPYGCGVKYARN